MILDADGPKKVTLALGRLGEHKANLLSCACGPRTDRRPGNTPGQQEQDAEKAHAHKNSSVHNQPPEILIEQRTRITHRNGKSRILKLTRQTSVGA